MMVCKWRLSWPLLAGMGAAPASMAKAASEWIRPGWDQAHKTMAATMGPTPNWLSRSGRQGAAGQVAQHRGGGGCLGVPAGADPQPGGQAEHRGKFLAPEPFPQLLG